MGRARSDGPAATKNVADVVFNFTDVMKPDALEEKSPMVSDHETNHQVLSGLICSPHTPPHFHHSRNKDVYSFNHEKCVVIATE